jgi:hypothetical protein
VFSVWYMLRVYKQDKVEVDCQLVDESVSEITAGAQLLSAVAVRCW